MVFQLAVRYLEKMDSSVKRLRSYLKRKSLEPIPENWIDTTIHSLQSIGLLDDQRVAEQVIRWQFRKGKANRAVQDKLLSLGLPKELPEEAEPEEIRAEMWAARWRTQGISEQKIHSRLKLRGFSASAILKATKK